MVFNMNNELHELHQLLITSYVKMMKAGETDPRMLKEIRELLKDNSITGDIVGMIEDINDVIELPDDFMETLGNG